MIRFLHQRTVLINEWKSIFSVIFKNLIRHNNEITSKIHTQIKYLFNMSETMGHWFYGC